MTTVSESFDARKGNWVKIEVYRLLQEWLNKPEENVGLVVTAYDSMGRQVAVTDPKEMPSNVSKNLYLPVPFLLSFLSIPQRISDPLTRVFIKQIRLLTLHMIGLSYVPQHPYGTEVLGKIYCTVLC